MFMVCSMILLLVGILMVFGRLFCEYMGDMGV